MGSRNQIKCSNLQQIGLKSKVIDVREGEWGWKLRMEMRLLMKNLLDKVLKLVNTQRVLLKKEKAQNLDWKLLP